MEHSGEVCDVCGCAYNEGGCKCSLSQIKVTEHCENCHSNVEEPHFCQSYEKR